MNKKSKKPNINKSIKEEKKIVSQLIELDFPLRLFDHMTFANVNYKNGKLVVFIVYESKKTTVLERYDV